MKTKEELNAIKAEYENIVGKLAALTEEELKQVAGGRGGQYMSVTCTHCGKVFAADISQATVYCTHCGVPMFLFG